MSAAAARPYQSFYFDCDSTLARIEGINELCALLDAPEREQVHALTEQAMNGEVALDQVYGRRLELIAPTAEQVEEIGRLYVEQMVPFTDEVVADLQSLGKTVGIVSGGLRPAVLELARRLGIPTEHVYAVGIDFDGDGRFRDFERDSPLCRNRGKVDVLRALPSGARPLVFVGDGVTDLETSGIADLFVGFGGVVAREPVRAGAHHFIDGPDLRPLLDIALTMEERNRLSDAG